jgi:hypothetical protein
MSTARVKVERTFRTSFQPGTLVTGSRIMAKIEIVLSASTVMRGTMISMVPTMTNLPNVILRLEAIMQEESSLSPMI